MIKTRKSVINFDKGRLSSKVLLDLYKGLLKPRMIEEKMLILLRQGRISKWFSGIGQEAIPVGCAMALQEDELIFTLHRNLGVFTSRAVPLERLFCQWQGKELGFTKGRDRSFHFGTLEYGIVGMISHLGPQLSLAGGAALAYKLSGERKVALAFTGEGGTSEGDFHEAMNVASVWNLPVIFVVENNGYGLSTPSSQQFKCKDIADKAIGYGMESVIVDGNNIIEVYQTITKLAKKIRKKPAPVLVECKTFRMRGHEEASGVKYVPPKLLEKWGRKDPLVNFDLYLRGLGILTDEMAVEIRQSFAKEIKDGLKIAFDQPVVESSVEAELADVYAPFEQVVTPPAGATSEKRLVDAISDGLRLAMEKHDNLVLMGQDIADYGGVFKITDGFLAQFGEERVRNTPICESAIVGIGQGLALKGYKAMVEMQFSDFVTCAFNQIVNNLAKLHYRWGEAADVVIRMPSGAGVAAGPYHSQSTEAWFFHTPGLKILYPSNPYDAKGMLLAAFEDPNPVLFFEHKALYRSISEKVPDAYYTVEIGKAATVREGRDLSIITYGMGVHWAEKIVEEMNIDADIVDLRSLAPLDYEAINDTVKKTHRVILLHEDVAIGGIGGELAAYISEHLFEYLDAPVMRVAGLDIPIPFAPTLEAHFLPLQRLKDALVKMLDY